MPIHTERKRKQKESIFFNVCYALSSLSLGVHRPYIYTRMWS